MSCLQSRGPDSHTVNGRLRAAPAGWQLPGRSGFLDTGPKHFQLPKSHVQKRGKSTGSQEESTRNCRITELQNQRRDPGLVGGALPAVLAIVIYLPRTPQQTCLTSRAALVLPEGHLVWSESHRFGAGSQNSRLSILHSFHCTLRPGRGSPSAVPRKDDAYLGRRKVSSSKAWSTRRRLYQSECLRQQIKKSEFKQL